MSRREIDGDELVERGNVVQLATAPRGAPARDAASPQTDAITRDGLELLKAFFAIEDPAARAALVVTAQRFAALSSKT